MALQFKKRDRGVWNEFSFETFVLRLVPFRDSRAGCEGTVARRAALSRMLADALTYLQSEHDLRGYDAELSWIHASAHTADLLQALASSSLLTKAEQASILFAIATRLLTAPQVYYQGEQDRMAAAILAVIRRSDFDKSSFENWLTLLQKEDKKVWTNPLTSETLAQYQNRNYFFQSLAVRLFLDPSTPRINDFRRQVLAVLRTR